MPDMSKLLSCVEMEPEVPARAAVIWLHGLGADGNDFVPIVPHLHAGDGLQRDWGVRFVFPTAPAIPVTINMGMVMPAWYDITTLDLKRRADEGGILKSAAHLEALIARENERGIPCERIVLAGFSQGGAVSAHVALRYQEAFAGLLALSTYLVRGETLEAERSDANRAIPIFQGHGTQDPMVPIARGQAAHDRLVELGYDVTWKTYPIQHEVCLEEIAHVGAWLAERLRPT